MPDPPEDTSQPQSAEAPGEPAGDAPAPEPRWRGWVPRRRQPPPEAAPAPQPTANGDEPPDQTTEAIEAPPRPEGPARLRRERRRLLASREEAVYNLGGLAFELYRRDRLDGEVMRRKAGEVAMLDDTVRDIDGRLGRIEEERRERRRRGPRDDAVGNCLECRAPFRAEARFCSQCGTRLVPGDERDDQVTAVISPPPSPPPEDEAS
jgi:hypothetical protein